MNLCVAAFSTLLAFGMSVAIVEKGQEWPIRRFNILLRKFVYKYNKKLIKWFI